MRKFNAKKQLGIWLLVIAFLVFLIFPLYWMFVTSVKTDAEIYANPLIYWPKHIVGDTYERLFGYFDFLHYMKNSLIVAVAGMLISLTVSLLAAYAFARYQFKGKRILMCVFLSNNMFPTVLLMIPLYSIMRNLGLLYSHGSLILSYTTFTIPFTVWLLQGFIKDFPFSLEEAALVDGCNRLTAFFYIFLPIIKQCLIAAGVYIFMQAWNEYTLSSMFTNPETRTIPVALNSLIGQLGVEWDMLCAGGIVAVLPVCIMFFFAQKRLVEGLTAGAVKG